MNGEIDLEIAGAAADRWAAREAVRQNRAGRNSAEVESADRLAKRLERLRINAARPTPALSTAESRPVGAMIPAMVHAIGLERVLAEPDFRGIAFLEQALAVSRSVGRVNIKDTFGRPQGYGTGFMVSPRLLMTNNHVLPSAEAARSSEIEFDYQHDRRGRPMASVPFALEPGTFFFTDRELDFTLVAVADRSQQGKVLALYGWSRLIPEQGKVLIKEPLNIIQHPRGRMKEIAFRSNELIDLLPVHAHYTTDTEPGSSGSPVYNDQWEVVALHHSGVPKRGADGGLVKADNTPWQDGDDPEELAWVANEGVRISVIYKAIEMAQLEPAQGVLRRELLELEPPSLSDMAGDEISDESDEEQRGSGPIARVGEATFELPLRITISLGGAYEGPSDKGASDKANGRAPLVTVALPQHAPSLATAGPSRLTEAEAVLAELERSRQRL